MSIRTTIFAAILCVSLFSIGCSSGRLKAPGDWNRTERGSAIGGASGAALGALVGSQSGNAGAGLLIGGIAGAGAGGLIGNELDNKEDR